MSGVNTVFNGALCAVIDHISPVETLRLFPMWSWGSWWIFISCVLDYLLLVNFMVGTSEVVQPL